MTKSFSALLGVALALGLAPAATAQNTFRADIFAVPQTTVISAELATILTNAGRSPMLLLDVPLPTYDTAPPRYVPYTDGPDGSADAAYNRALHRAAVNPRQWAGEALPYQVSVPGPSNVGVIRRPIPEGWVVTHRCLGWDPYYATAEAPQGDCYVYELRSLIDAPTRPPHR